MASCDDLHYSKIVTINHFALWSKLKYVVSYWPTFVRILGEVKKKTCLASPPASFFEAACFFFFFFFLLLKKQEKYDLFQFFFFFFIDWMLYRKIAFYIFRLPHQLFHSLWKLSRMSGSHLEKIGQPVVLENVSGGHFEEKKEEKKRLLLPFFHRGRTIKKKKKKFALNTI